MSASRDLVLLICIGCLFSLSGCNPPKPSSQPNEAAPSNNGDSDKSTSVQKQDAKTNQAAKEIPANSPQSAKPDINDERFHLKLREIASEYLGFAMVNTKPLAAPADCAPATAPEDEMPQPKLSEADDGGHANKLYFLFAKDIANYFDEQADATEGQVLVKESWTSKESNPGARNMRNHASANRINPRVDVDGKVLEIGKRNLLFIMTKMKPDTDGTDDGWVYGVVDTETETVHVAGKVASCIACHQTQKDKMFRKDVVTIIDERVVEDSCVSEDCCTIY